MVVDDDFIIRDLFERALGREGYEILTADTGEKCLEVIAKEGVENIKLVFLDLKMPGIGGMSTLRVLKSCYDKLPVIVISAYGNLPTQIEVVKKNVVQYISKPFDIEYIKIIMRNAITPGIQ